MRIVSILLLRGGCVTLLAIAIWLKVCAPNPTEIAPGEGREMSKALHIAKHSNIKSESGDLISKVYLELIAYSWQITNGWTLGRLFNISIAALWTLVMPEMIPKGKWLHGFCVVILLLASPHFLALGCSINSIVPAFGLAILSTVPIIIKHENIASGFSYFLAGCILGIAVCFDTAALSLFPALAVFIGTKTNLRYLRQSLRSFDLRRWIEIPVLIWVLAFLITIVMFGTIGTSHFIQEWRSLATRSEGLSASEPRRFSVYFSSFLAQPGTLICVVAGTIFLIKQHKHREMAFPLILFGVPAILELFPQVGKQWGGVGMASGAAILGGWGLAELIYLLLRNYRYSKDKSTPINFELSLMLAASVLALISVNDFSHACTAVKSMVELPSVKDNQIIAALSTSSDKIRYAYSSNPALLAQAGILTISDEKIPSNRLLQKQQVADILKNRHPDATILSKTFQQNNPSLELLLRENYVLTAGDETSDLYLVKSLGSSALESTADRLRKIGF